MTSPAEREFDFYPRGQKREELLTNFRIGLRLMTNPDTGVPFTETEIATATAPGSRFWIEADAIDIVLLVEQQRAFWLADQVDPERASSAWLVDYHGRLWGEAPLPATGGSGLVTVTATPLTTFPGSTTLGDPAATSCTDPAGLRYQVQQTLTVPFGGTAQVVLLAIDAGSTTNLTAGTELTWVSPPTGAAAKATVASDFSGGTDAETDAEFVQRLEARIRRKPGAGNGSHVRGWARAASNAIADACVYACAFHAGSTLVSVLQKRAGVAGPSARIASVSTLLAATNYLVPPSSPVFPARAHVVVGTPTPEATDVALELSMTTGVTSGWSDPAPWPTFLTVAAAITTVDSPTIFRMQNLPAIPLGVTAPKLMIWNAATTRFESLAVAGVAQTSPTDFVVSLQRPPSTKALAVGDLISPDTNLRDLIGETVENYFDSLGPGEVLNLATDPRGHRALRYPRPNEELPFRAGSSISSWLGDALGFALSNAQLLGISKTAPSIPTNPIDGPRLLTAGRVAVYPGDL